MERVIKRFPPAPLLQLHRDRADARWWATQSVDRPDVKLVERLCPRGCVAVDVGANHGVCTTPLSRIAENVHAFEPQPAMYRLLRNAFRFNRRVTVHDVALSDHVGEAELCIPLQPSGKPLDDLASIEECNTLDGLPVRRVLIRRARLDDFRFHGVGFVKIDVGEHQLAVIRGAGETLRRERPALLIEAEQHHKPDLAAQVISYMSYLGYGSWFIWQGDLVLLERFDVRIHQWPGATDHAVNFVFRPA